MEVEMLKEGSDGRRGKRGGWNQQRKNGGSFGFVVGFGFNRLIEDTFVKRKRRIRCVVDDFEVRNQLRVAIQEVGDIGRGRCARPKRVTRREA